MLTVWGQPHRFCDGMNRREFLRVGGLGIAGLGLADLLRHEAHATPAGRPKSVIYVVLGGGPSHIDMWDLKPDAPDEYRGPFRPIATRLPGVQICESMPLQAAMMDRLALLRGIRSVENDHYLSEVYTGLPRRSGQRPAFGSVVSRLAGPSATLPPVRQPRAGHDRPVRVREAALRRARTRPVPPVRRGPRRPGAGAFNSSNCATAGSSCARFDTMRRELDRQQEFRALDEFQARALDIITSPRVRDAFDLSQEPDRVIAAYGKGKYPHQVVENILYDWEASPFVLARRLVEAGVRVVTLRVGSWDHHSAPRRRHLLRAALPDAGARPQHVRPVQRPARARPGRGRPGRRPGRVRPDATHLAARARAASTGPTPAAPSSSAAACAWGRSSAHTDSRAERCRSGNITFQNIIATIYHVLGIDRTAQLTDFNGRPQNLLDDIEPIRELVV